LVSNGLFWLVIYKQIFICFGWIFTTMGRPKKTQHKIKTGITLDPELFEWVQSKIEIKEFSNLTHAIEKSLMLMREKMDGKKK